MASEASADPNDVVTVSAKPCESSSWAPFIDQLSVELAEDHVQVEWKGEAADLTVGADACSDDATSATLILSRGGEHRKREVDLSGVAPNAKARVLALSAAELLRGAMHGAAGAPPKPLELRVTLQALRPPREQPRLVPPPPAAPSHGFSLWLAGEVRSLPEVSTGLIGGRAGLSIPVGDLVALTLDFGVATATAHDVLGAVTTLSVGGAVGVVLALGPPSIRVHVGPRLELDYLGFSGAAGGAGVVGASTESPGVLVMLGATAHLPVTGGLWALLGLDAGTTLYGYRAQAESRTAAGVLGPLLGLRVGLAWSGGLP